MDYDFFYLLADFVSRETYKIRVKVDHVNTPYPNL